MGRKKIVISKKELAKSQKYVNLACDILGSQSALAERLDITRQAVSSWCCGTSRINRDSAVAISNVLKGEISPDQLEAKNKII